MIENYKLHTNETNVFALYIFSLVLSSCAATLSNYSWILISCLSWRNALSWRHSSSSGRLEYRRTCRKNKLGDNGDLCMAKLRQLFQVSHKISSHLSRSLYIFICLLHPLPRVIAQRPYVAIVDRSKVVCGYVVDL